MKCKHCKKETKNPKFCSRSCSASFNNKGIRRHGSEPNKCSNCSKIKKWKSKLCIDCKIESTFKKNGNKTLKSYKLNDRNARTQWNQVRKHAREAADRYDIPNECKICQFDRYTEVCHIKGIADFTEDAKLKTVNSASNLMRLCPNHHKLFDKEMLTETEKDKLR
jgi:hypothetical protein